VIDGKIKKYGEKEAHLSSEPEAGEGLKELLVKGKALESGATTLCGRIVTSTTAWLFCRCHRAGIGLHHYRGNKPAGLQSALIVAVGIVSTLNGVTLVYTVLFIG